MTLPVTPLPSLEEQFKLAAADEQMNREFAEWEGIAGDGLDETNTWCIPS